MAYEFQRVKYCVTRYRNSSCALISAICPGKSAHELLQHLLASTLVDIILRNNRDLAILSLENRNKPRPVLCR